MALRLIPSALHALQLLVLLSIILASSVAASNDNVLTTVDIYGRLDVPPLFLSPLNSDVAAKQGFVYLTDGSMRVSVPVQEDGSFVVYRLSYGSYHAHFELGPFIFPTVRVDVQQLSSCPVFRCYANDADVTLLVGSGGDKSDPVIISPIGAHEYYIPREQYSIMMFLKNPMILLMLFSFGLMGMMKMLPEEDRKEGMKEYKKMRSSLLSAMTPAELAAEKRAVEQKRK